MSAILNVELVMKVIVVNWAKENGTVPSILSLDEDDSVWEKIEYLYPIVEKIYFAGGEPLIMDSHYKILDKLIEYQKFDVKLIYTTNFSTLEYKGKHIFDYWEKFPNLKVSVSMDGNGKRGELIRKGLDYQKFSDNVRKFYEKFSQQTDQLGVICTVELLNSFDVIDLHRKLYENGIIKSLDNFQLNFLFYPSYLSVNCLPSKLKKQLLHNIRDHILNYLKPKGADISYFVSYAKLLTLKSTIDELKLL